MLIKKIFHRITRVLLFLSHATLSNMNLVMSFLMSTDLNLPLMFLEDCITQKSDNAIVV